MATLEFIAKFDPTAATPSTGGGNTSNATSQTASPATSILTGASPFNISPLSLFLVQALIVIITARILAIGMKFIRQPVVMAEVIGGLILGGSALSRITVFKNTIFPTSSLAGFNLVAQFGLMLYLFLIGLEVDPSSLIKLSRKSLPISLAGITLPFVLGVAVSKLLYDRYADPAVSFTSFFIFTGVAMSITAFPVLARILTERNLLPTKVGITTIAAAAVDDVMAWTLLVLVVALINTAGGQHASASQYASAVYVFLVVIGTAGFLWLAVRPLLTRLVKQAKEREHLSSFVVFVSLALALAFGWFTEVIGVHAIFGAFLVGCVIPHDYGFARKLASQMEDLITAIFLPLYFAYSGLNTRIDLLNTAEIWGWIILVIVVACAGKVIGCTSMAKLVGHTWRESFAIGVLMNTKGLVELIVLNIGLNAGVITPTVFSMFVVMAIVTTLMTVPLISVIYPEHAYVHELYPIDSDTKKDDDLESTPTEGETTNLLVCLPNISSAQSTVAFTALIAQPNATTFSIFGLRLIHLDERYTTLMKANEHDQITISDTALTVLRAFSSIRNLVFHPLVSFTRSIAPSIIEAATHTHAALVIVPTKDSHEIKDIVAGSTPTATVVQLIDHGFPNTSDAFVSESLAAASALAGQAGDSSATVRSQISTVSLKTPKLRAIVLVIDTLDSPDNSEAFNLARSIVTAELNLIKKKFELHVVLVNHDESGASSADRKLSLPAGLVAASQVTVAPGLILQTVNEIASHGTDLIIVGHSTVEVASGEEGATNTFSFAAASSHAAEASWAQHVFDQVHGTVAVVYGHNDAAGEKKFISAK